MNWLDVVLAVILACSIVAGLRKGLARELVALVSVLAALVLAIWFYGTAGSFVLPYVSHKAIASFIGFTLVFALVVVAGAVFGKLLAALMKWTGLGWLDRLGGAAFGLARGLVVGIVLVMALLAFSVKPPPRAVADSRLAPYVVEAARLLVAIAPRELRDGFYDSYDRVKRIWEETLRRDVHALPRQDL